MAFIDEDAKSVFRVDNPKTATALVGDHVELVARRRGSKSLHIVSVRVLEKYAAKCDVP